MTWSESFLTYTAFSFTHLRDGCFLGGTSGVSVCVIALAHPLNSAKTYVSFFTSRTITALAFVESVLVYSRMLSGYYVFFTPSLLFKLPPQIWRMFTSFLLTGSGISFIFDLYFSMMSRSATLVSSSVNSVHSVSLFKFAGDCFAPLYPARRFFHLSGFCSLCDFGKWLAWSWLCLLKLCFSSLSAIAFLYTQLLPPRISARPALYSWSGSWKWGRLPLHPVQYRIRKIQMVLHAVWDWWDCHRDSCRDPISSHAVFYGALHST